MSNIHHEVRFSAEPSRVYALLVDSSQFAEFSGAPASGAATVGTSFFAFGGFITGRHVELVPDRRIVQAWRAKNWPEGVYSIARFQLRAEGTGTTLVFDHDGFPNEMKDELASGWHANYWEKMTRYLSGGDWEETY